MIAISRCTQQDLVGTRFFLGLGSSCPIAILQVSRDAGLADNVASQPRSSPWCAPRSRGSAGISGAGRCTPACSRTTGVDVMKLWRIPHCAPPTCLTARAFAGRRGKTSHACRGNLPIIGTQIMLASRAKLMAVRSRSGVGLGMPAAPCPRVTRQPPGSSTRRSRRILLPPARASARPRPTDQ